MKNLFLSKGKKLDKKQLRTIAGGLINCMEAIICTDPPCEIYGPDDPRACTLISASCAQKICRP
ncbi:hypothetical protein ACM39_06860 [Chryseobacterium sp. FH2]|uniref:hypothetical protein n=1 Tax=Chryseobacterium sp. FH2 TaxID=1674291 RepID=UPI00065AB9E0|nr:hypothetical protein [Chryseobacterium sp. FH2]KMQ68991.1 hypothetical protein ACM39_06860 [Chryseobacterium sp. FH2]